LDPLRYAPNFTSDTAFNFGALTGTQSYPTLGITTVGGVHEDDYFRWTMSSGGTFTATITNITSNGDLWVKIYQVNANNTLTLIGQATGLGHLTTQSAAAQVTAGESVIVNVVGFNFAVGTYDMAESLT
jgi:hypothetical protein